MNRKRLGAAGWAWAVVALAAAVGAGCIPSVEIPQEEAYEAPAPVEAEPEPQALADVPPPQPVPPDAPPLDELLAQWEVYAANPAQYLDNTQATLLVGDLLRYYGDDGFAPLFEILDSEDADPVLKVMVTGHLTTFATQATMVEALLPLVEPDRDATTRACAAHILAHTQQLNLADDFLRLKEDEDERVRFSALMGLAMIGHPGGTEPLAEMYRAGGLPMGQRRNILAALTRLPRPENAGLFLAAALDETLDQDLRMASLLAVGQIGDAEALPDLDRMAVEEQEPNLRSEAAFSAKAIRERLGLAAPAQE